MAFSSDSFSQDAGDFITWKMTCLEFPSAFWSLHENDSIRVYVIEAYSALYEGNSYDTLQVIICNRSPTFPTWTIAFEAFIRYNGSAYLMLDFGFGEYPWIIPHNETVVVQTFISQTPANYSWVPGPNGYDGTFSTWYGSLSGDLGAERADYKYNSEGIMECWTYYYGLGPGWDVKLKWELIDTAGSDIPGFPTVLVLFTLGSSLIAYVLMRKRSII